MKVRAFTQGAVAWSGGSGKTKTVPVSLLEPPLGADLGHSDRVKQLPVELNEPPVSGRAPAGGGDMGHPPPHPHRWPSETEPGRRHKARPTWDRSAAGVGKTAQSALQD